VLCVVALTLLCPRAHAAAPLCDPSGASMPAPIPVLPNATGDLVAPKGCDDQAHELLDLVKPNRGDAPVARGVDVPDRVVVAPPVWPKAAGAKIPRPSRASVPDLPGHSLPVYRPPRA
jgi:hypothetical protein